MLLRQVKSALRQADSVEPLTVGLTNELRMLGSEIHSLGKVVESLNRPSSR